MTPHDDKVLLTWEEWQTIPNGSHEVDDFKGVNVGFGNALVNMLRGAVVTGSSPAHKPLRSFFSRAPGDQLKQSPHQDPKSFMRALRASMRGRKEESQAATIRLPGAAPVAGDKAEATANAINLSALPIIFFNRQPGYTVYDGGDGRYVDERLYNIVGYEGCPPLFNVSLHHEVLTYRLFVLAWDQLTLDHLTRTLDAKFRHHITGFNYQTTLMDFSIPSRADVITKRLTWDDMSPGIETDRLLCVSATVEVVAQAFQAWGLEANKVMYELLEPTPMFGGGEAL